MPHSARHQEQKSKNLAFLAMLVVLIAILFSLPFLKMKLHATPAEPAAAATEEVAPQPNIPETSGQEK